MDLEDFKIKNSKVPKKETFKVGKIKVGERITIFGKTRSGKSWFTCFLANAFARKQLTIILDRKKEYKLRELPADFLKKRKGLFKFSEITYDGKILDVTHKDMMEFICLNAFNRGNTCLILEEIGSYLQKSGYAYENTPNFAAYLSQGAAKKCSLIVISQRPAQLHTDVPSQSEHIFCFKLGSPHDIKAVENWFPREKVKALNKYEFLHYCVDDDEIHHYRPLYASQLVWGMRYLGEDKRPYLEG